MIIVDRVGDSSSVISDELVDHPVVFVRGDGWIAFAAEQGATGSNSTLQLQVTNQADKLFKQAHDGTTPSALSESVQRSVSTALSASLDGSVVTTR